MKKYVVKLRPCIYLFVCFYFIFLLFLALSFMRLSPNTLSGAANYADSKLALSPFFVLQQQQQENEEETGKKHSSQTTGKRDKGQEPASSLDETSVLYPHAWHLRNLFSASTFVKMKQDSCSTSHSIVVSQSSLLAQTTKFTLLRNVFLSAVETSKSTQDRGELFNFKSNFLSQICDNDNSSSSSRNSTRVTNRREVLEVGCTASLQIVHLTPTSFSALSFKYNTSNLNKVPPVVTFDWLVFLVRNEYANPFWSVIDIFDVFHIISRLKQQLQTPSLDDSSFPMEPHVLWLDAHPPSPTDGLWHVLFGESHVHQLSHFLSHPSVLASSANSSSPDNIIFAANLIARFHRRHSVFLKTLSGSTRTLISSFRQEAFNKLGLFNVTIDAEKSRSCSSSLRLTVVWRRDYVNHPGNSAGKISRKISNEQQVLSTLKELQHKIDVTEVQLETLSAKDQIRVMSSTDIFFGMHGAGHVMSTFMPPGGVVIELTIDSKASNANMRKVAENAGHTHLREVLPKSSQSADTLSHYVPQTVVQKLLKAALAHFCET